MKQVVTTTVNLEAWEEEYLVTYFEWTSNDIRALKQGDQKKYEDALEKINTTEARCFGAGWNAHAAYMDEYG